MDQSRGVFLKIYQAIAEAKRILVVSDGKPDGDSVGSSSAMLNWLLREGKDVTAFCPVELPHAFRFIDGYERYSSDPAVLDRGYDLVLVFDASDLKHGGNDVLPARLPEPYTLACFDHHATNPHYGDLNAVFVEACSTCEVAYNFFEANGIVIDDRMATSLLTGLCTDTSNFSNAATNASGMDAAAHLCSMGARYTDIIKHLVQNKSVPSLKLWGLALSRLVHDRKQDTVVTYFLRSDLEGLPNGDEAVEGVANFLNASCNHAETVLVLREKPDGTVKGSYRSLSRDVSLLAKERGGGGHKKAAGFAQQGRIEVVDGLPQIVA